MFLSIIIPVYNCEKYLSECLDSCFDQDIDKNEYEVLCVNDGSTDNSLSVLEKYKAQNKNMVIINQPNRGQHAATRAGFLYASGEYIWLVDSDDFIKKNCLSEVKKISKDNYDLINFTGYKVDENTIRENLIKSGNSDNRELRKMSYKGYRALHAFKREIILRDDFPFYPEICYGEDEMLFVVINEFAESTFDLDQSFYYYRLRSNSLMDKLRNSEKHRRRRMEDVIYSMEILRDKILSCKFKKEYSYQLMRGRYDLSKFCLAQFKAREAQRYFTMMIDKGFFDSKLLSILDLEDKESFERDYIRQQPYERQRLKNRARKRRIKRVTKLIPYSIKDRIKRRIDIDY